MGSDHRTENGPSQGQNPALPSLFVPNSLESGQVKPRQLLSGSSFRRMDGVINIDLC